MIQQGAKATGDPWRDCYQTPRYILDAVEAVLGEFWFDPCPKVRRPDWDGLTMPWQPYAYINPPFSEYGEWVEWGLQQPGPQIWICHSNTDTKWYHRLLDASSAMVLTKGRTYFIDPRTGEPSKEARQGQTVFFRGESRIAVFMYEFDRIGRIIAL
jgi:hypothetical protein